MKLLGQVDNLMSNKFRTKLFGERRRYFSRKQKKKKTEIEKKNRKRRRKTENPDVPTSCYFLRYFPVAFIDLRSPT
jgi:hypothetical protein